LVESSPILRPNQIVSMALTTNTTIASFGGKLLKLSHDSALLGCKMNLNLYLPPSKSPNEKFPVLWWLSGLTCTGDNCAEKGFFQATASHHGIAIVYPDTSPRGLDLPGEDEAADFGSGAGFYIDAAKEPWAKHYKMNSYITKELPDLLYKEFPLNPSKVSICGHSMGGHGALCLFLQNPGMYKSVSALSPIANPSNCPWGQKAFKGYLGENAKDMWKANDATELVKQWKGDKLDVLIDVGTGDNFYQQKQLLPENFVAAAKQAGHGDGVTLRMQPDYDHSYYVSGATSCC